MYDIYLLISWLCLGAVAFLIGLATAYRIKHKMPIVDSWKNISRFQKTLYILSVAVLVFNCTQSYPRDSYMLVVTIAGILGVLLVFLVKERNAAIINPVEC